MRNYSIEFNTMVKYSAVIYSASYVSPLDDLLLIEEDLRFHVLKGTYVLFDLLLSNGENYNRFVEGFFDGKTVKQESLKIVDIAGKELELINKHYAGKARILNNSVLTPSAKFKYMKSKSDNDIV